MPLYVFLNGKNQRAINSYVRDNHRNTCEQCGNMELCGFIQNRLGRKARMLFN